MEMQSHKVSGGNAESPDASNTRPLMQRAPAQGIIIDPHGSEGKLAWRVQAEGRRVGAGPGVRVRMRDSDGSQGRSGLLGACAVCMGCSRGRGRGGCSFKAPGIVDGHAGEIPLLS